MKPPFHEPVTDPYLKERICDCDVFTYESTCNFDKLFETCERPPTCAVCGKWADRVHICLHCRQQYYQFFMHPLMATEAALEKFPWECWDCLEVWVRWVNCPVNTKKIPPPVEVLVPKRVPQVMTHSTDYDSALAFLQKLTGKA